MDGISLGPIPHPDPHAVLASIRGTPGQPSGASECHAAAHGDSVMLFDEMSAAEGALGRFPGIQVMALLKSLLLTVTDAMPVK